MTTYRGNMIRKQSSVNSMRSNHCEVLEARKDVQDMFQTEQVYTITNNDMFVFAVLGDAHRNTLYTYVTGQFQMES